MNRSLLEKPFEPGQIRRRGRNGWLDYVEGHSVIQRLNDALDGGWSFEITHHEVRESGQLVSLGDDLKAASTDAVKKCATFLGVGLHLYADKPLNGSAPRASHAGNGRSPAAERPVAAATPAGPGPTNGHRPEGATERQLETILKIGRARGLGPADIEGMSTRAFGHKPGQLNRAEASTLIKEFGSGDVTGGRRQHQEGDPGRDRLPAWLS